jgi:hypothetical protein
MKLDPLYEATTRRLARKSTKDTTGQIIALVEKINYYREKIMGLEAYLYEIESKNKGETV